MRSHIIDTVATSPAHAETRARNSWTAVLTSIALGDAVSVAASFALAYTLRFWLGWEIFREGYVHPEFYAILTGVLVCCWVGIFALYGLYNPHNLFGGTHQSHRGGRLKSIHRIIEKNKDVTFNNHIYLITSSTKPDISGMED